MREQLQEIATAAETLYSMTHGRDCLTRGYLRNLQAIVDDIQDALDLATNEAIRAEQDDEYDRRQAYPITDEPWE